MKDTFCLECLGAIMLLVVIYVFSLFAGFSFAVGLLCAIFVVLLSILSSIEKG